MEGARSRFYVDLMKDAGPDGASSNGFNENLTLFQQGKCGMWIDATVAASFVTDPKNSTVADKVGFAIFPDKPASATTATGCGRGTSPSRPARKNAEAAQTFIAWATDKAYTATRRREGGLGQRASGHPHLALRERRVQGGRTLRRRRRWRR